MKMSISFFLALFKKIKLIYLAYFLYMKIFGNAIISLVNTKKICFNLVKFMCIPFELLQYVRKYYLLFEAFSRKYFFLKLRDYRSNSLAEAIVCSYVAVIFLDLNVIMLKVGFLMINATTKLVLY